MDDQNKASQQSPQKNSSWKSLVKEIGIFIVIAICVVLPFRMFIAEPYIVSGPSMDPTFTTGDYLIVDKLSYELGNPARNSVVIFKFPTNSSLNLIKRIIGVPGDTVTVTNGDVTITNGNNPDGFSLNESYLTHPQADSFTITLGADQYFVMGDNRPVSYDSRSWGILPRKDIIGRPLLRLFPINKIGTLPGNAMQ